MSQIHHLPSTFTCCLEIRLPLLLWISTICKKCFALPPKCWKIMANGIPGDRNESRGRSRRGMRWVRCWLNLDRCQHFVSWFVQYIEIHCLKNHILEHIEQNNYTNRMWQIIHGTFSLWFIHSVYFMIHILSILSYHATFRCILLHRSCMTRVRSRGSPRRATPPRDSRDRGDTVNPWRVHSKNSSCNVLAIILYHLYSLYSFIS